MSIENDENQKIETPLQKNSKVDAFKKTAAAAQMSGAFNQSAGLFKRKMGELTDDTSLITAGREQQLLGKVHRLVSKVREVREAAQKSLTHSRTKGAELFRKHGGQLVDLASDFVDDIKKVLVK